ncbi:hypothetical protein BDP27DRAFT_1385081 [Rhodocollybia butyracea]|uniref:Uncharacterized protein n=1 Tax=Rhodocollybia butyracea TaxID=206335 RepID=A0A9P5PGB8_9AGAR|nr:hypothetical protein BDP27DRAFT_1385081 [Rhodocollybia butyracea]
MITTVAPQDTTKFVHHYPVPTYEFQHYPTAHTPVATSTTPAPVPVASTSASNVNNSLPSAPSGSGSTAPTSGPLVATGDWTRDLVHLAKTAELKKHALTVQLHTAHILSAHASLEQKSKSIQDVKEQRNKLDSERTRLLTALRQVNEDRDKADLLEADLERECTTLRSQVHALSEGDYSVSKADVDRLRAELGHPPLPTLQSILDEKAAAYLTERRLNGNTASGPAATPAAASTSSTPASFQTASYAVPAPAPAHVQPMASASTSTLNANYKRNASPAVDGGASSTSPASAKRPRGRPKGSKNQKRT